MSSVHVVVVAVYDILKNIQTLFVFCSDHCVNMDYGACLVRAMALNPLCATRMRLDALVHVAFDLCNTHMSARPVIVSAVTQLLGLLHAPGALVEPPRRFSPRAPLQWLAQHKRLIELKKADARVQVLAVLLVAIVAMAREPADDYMGSQFAARVLSLAQHNKRLPIELRCVMNPPHLANNVLKYDRDNEWHRDDALQDNANFASSVRHARPVWSAYYQTAFFGLERQSLQHGGHLRWAEPDAVQRGGAAPIQHDQRVTKRAAQAARVGLMLCEYESLPWHLRNPSVSPGAAQSAYDQLHCRERFQRLTHDHPGFWTPRSGYHLSPMWHNHFPLQDDFKTCVPPTPTPTPTPTPPPPKILQPQAQGRNSDAEPAPGGSRLACLVRTFSSARQRLHKPPQSDRAEQDQRRPLSLCCSRRRRAQTVSAQNNNDADHQETECQRAHKRCRQS